MSSHPLNRDPAYEPVAIIGMACRYPGADNLSRFWQMLESGTFPIREIPPDRWPVDRYYDPIPGTPSKMYVRSFGFMNGVDQFDSYLFGISPRDAARMDPQHRIMLEICWEAVEHAGISPAALAGTGTGVFVGVSGSDYAHRLTASESALELMDNRSGTGNSYSFTANRVSYALDLSGPSLVVDTACSSALVAIHLACESLDRRECELAICGAVSVILSPLVAISLCQSRMLSPDGHPRVFDAEANGYVRSEGCGAVILKRLADAVRDRDRVWAVIRGSGVNHNGKTCGIMAPSSKAQATLIAKTLQQARIDPRKISYIEAHGSGTPLGDLLELRSLSAVMGPRRGRKDHCWVGSVKSNIGHLECASGIAAITKVALCFEHARIPPQMHLSKINPGFEADHTRVRVAAHGAAWPRTSSPRIAGINAFGFGGTNAHIVMEEPPNPAPTRNPPARKAHILKLSAKKSESLDGLLQRWLAFLETCSDRDLPDVCYTANTGRADFPYRLAITADSKREMVSKLSEIARGSAPFIQIPSNSPRVVFLFPPIADASVAASQLLKASPGFRALLDGFRKSRGGVNAICVQLALARFWSQLGVRPSAVCGIGTGQRAATKMACEVAAADRQHVECLTLGRPEERSELWRWVAERADIVLVIGTVIRPKNTPGLWIDSLTPGCDAWRSLLEAIRALYLAGYSLNWAAIDSLIPRRKRPVPTYAFAKTHHPFPFSPS